MANAQSYQFELFEQIEERGSTSTLLVWQVITSANRLFFPARTVLRNGYFEWHVIALNEAGKGVVSERRNFTYSVPSGKLNVLTLTEFGNNLSRVAVKVIPIQGNGETVDFSTTDSGTLELELQPGSYQLSFSKFGFRDTVLTAEVEVNQSSEARIYLRLLTRTVTGSVVDQNNEPVSHARIVAIDLLNSRHKTTMVSDVPGRFQFPLSGSIYGLFAAKSGYLPADTVQIDLTSQSEISLAAPLRLKENTSRILGKVTNQNGVPIFGVKVEANRDKIQLSTLTDMNGAFQLAIGSGSWDVVAQKPGYSQENPRIISVNENQTITLSPDLIIHSNAASLSGLITDGDKGIADVEITAISSQGNTFKTQSNDKGHFSIDLMADLYQLYFHHEGYIDPLPQHLSLEPDQNISDLVIKMSPALSEVTGKILSHGLPLFNAIVTNGIAYDTSRIDGYYDLKLAPGTHQLFVKKTGYYQDNFPQITLSPGQSLTNYNIELLPGAATIKGRISSGNRPIPFARVMAIQGNDSLKAYSDLSGDFSFSVAPGLWKLVAAKEGYLTGSYPDIAVQANQVLQGIEIILAANYGIVKGQIIDSQNNKISQALIICQQRSQQAISDYNGNYTLQLSPGDLAFSVYKEGYENQSINATISQSQTTTLNFVLNKYGTVTGKITDPNGTPINRATVLAFQGSDTLKDYSDYAGEYRLNLPDGSYQLQADKLGYAVVQQQLSLQNAQVLIRNIELPFKPEEIAEISGNVSVDNRFPLPGVLVKLFGKQSKETQTNLNGSYMIQQLETQFDYSLKPARDSYFFIPPYRRYAPLTESKTTEQNFVASLFGDLSNNQEVSSFDGSLVLRISARKNITPYFTTFPRDSLAADVSGNKKISSFDASLIFRYTVGLINRFPVQDSMKITKEKSAGREKAFVRYELKKLNSDTRRLIVFISESPQFYSLDAILTYPASLYEPIDMHPAKALRQMHYEWNHQNGRLFFAFAAPEKISFSGADTLFSVDFHSKASEKIKNPDELFDLQLEFDEGAFPISIERKTNIPDRFYVSQNYPNPFNSTTVFEIWLPKLSHERSSKLRVEIYNLLGQKVGTIVDRELQPGFYRFQWPENPAHNYNLCSGLYFVLVKYAQYHELKKMVLVR
ncbi:MAG: T9SS type A sorting domain-containing protein [Calditrichaeota bacterium]|nr:T9SS type A sorting domain-containing protein [Calditrichota bacterium]